MGSVGFIYFEKRKFLEKYKIVKSSVDKRVVYKYEWKYIKEIKMYFKKKYEVNSEKKV